MFRSIISNYIIKKEHFAKLSSKLDDPLLGPKTYWSILNGFLGKNKIPVIPPLIVNDTFETNLFKKASLFNDYFARQCSLIDNSSNLPQMKFRTDNRLNTISIDNESILNIIRSLNSSKAHGWDGISIKIIKRCDQSIIAFTDYNFQKCNLIRYFP